jgi:hypothetical protein
VQALGEACVLGDEAFLREGTAHAIGLSEKPIDTFGVSR